MKSRPKKKEIVVFYIYYRGRGRAVGDSARTRVREKGKSGKKRSKKCVGVTGAVDGSGFELRVN